MQILMTIVNCAGLMLAISSWILMFVHILDRKAKFRQWMRNHENMQLAACFIMLTGAVCTAFLLDTVYHMNIPMSGICEFIKLAMTLIFLTLGICVRFIDHGKSREFFERHVSLQGLVMSVGFLGFGGLIQIIISS